jgi:hypothetical protein
MPPTKEKHKLDYIHYHNLSKKHTPTLVDSDTEEIQHNSFYSQDSATPVKVKHRTTSFPYMYHLYQATYSWYSGMGE